MAEPSISIIVCTRNRSARLANTLASLARLDIAGASVEAVVVDNGSTDDTRATIESFAATAPFEVRYRHQGRAGLSYARNDGLAHASGTIIMFTDDDCIVSADWVRVALELCRQDDRKIIGGRVELFDQNQPSNIVRTSMADEALTHPGQLFGFLHGANMVFGRSVVDAVGNFDVRFGAGTKLRSAEDTDFIYRAFEHGIPVIYDPRLLISHDHGRSGNEIALAQSAGYCVGMGAMMLKHCLRGQTGLVKPIYWSIGSAVRVERRRWGLWQACKIQFSLLAGMLRYGFVDVYKPEN